MFRELQFIVFPLRFTVFTDCFYVDILHHSFTSISKARYLK